MRGFVMRIICQLSVTGTDDLKKRITEAIMALRIPQNMARHEYRPDVIRATKGAHVEVY